MISMVKNLYLYSTVNVYLSLKNTCCSLYVRSTVFYFFQIFRSIIMFSSALYAFSMKNDMPVGIPFYLEKKQNGSFTHKLATSRKDFSFESLHFLNWTASGFENLPNATPFRTILNGEKEVSINGQKYRIDGYVKVGETEFFFEFLGCRYFCQIILEKKYVFEISYLQKMQNNLS